PGAGAIASNTGRLASIGGDHGEEAQGEEEGCEVEKACSSRSPKKNSGAKAGSQGKSQVEGKVGEAEAPRGEDQAAAARQRCLAADASAGPLRDADRVAAVAVPVIGAGRFPDPFARWQGLTYRD